MTEDRRQKTEDRRQKTEDRGQRTEDGGQRELRGYEYILCAFLSFISLYAVTRYFFGGNINYGNSVINLFLFVVIFRFSLKNMWVLPEEEKALERPVRKYALISSIVLGVVLVFGESLYLRDNFSLIFGSAADYLTGLVKLQGLVYLFSIILTPVFKFLRDYNSEKPAAEIKLLSKRPWLFGEEKRSLFTVWAAIFLCWIPVWLAYYPGIFSYDADQQLMQILGQWDLSNHHPVLHTLFMKGCFKIGWLFGDNNAGLIAYSMIQMLLLSFIFSFALWRLAKIGVRPGLRLFILAAFALNPVSSVFSFVVTKDATMGGFFVLFTVLLIEAVHDGKEFFGNKIKLTAFALSALLVCLLRNNALYALFLFGILFVLICRKYWRPIALTLGVSLVAAYLISGPLYTWLGVKPGSKGEMMSVPAQQIALVAVNHWDELDEELKNEINTILPVNIAERFNPRFADPIKGAINISVFEADKARFAKLWLKLFAEYPSDYMAAALDLNLAYWYPDTQHPDSHSNRRYIETNIYTGRGETKFEIQRKSVFPALLKQYEVMTVSVDQQSLPFIGFLYNIAAPVWAVFLCIMLCFVKGRRSAALICLPAAALWLTFMAGPVANMRYMYPIIMCCPIYLAAIVSMKFQPRKREEEEIWTE